MEILEQNRMLLNLVFEQQAEWNEGPTLLLSELDSSRTIDRPDHPGNQSKIFMMMDPLQYCGGVKELAKFLETLGSNFASYKHLFLRGNPNQVMYAGSFLDTWNNYLDMTQRQTENMDQSESARDL